MTLVKKICWPVLLYIASYHVFLMIAIPLYFLHNSPSGTLIGISAALVFISGLAITAGYHRLYSHTSYKTNSFVEAVLLFFGSLATQGSALRWCHDHRLHHAFVDTDKDPYSVKKGLLHAHILWMFFRTDPIEPKVVADLSRNQLVQFQHKHYVFCMLFSNLSVCLFVGWLLNDYWGAFLFSWWVRLFFLHHTTWCINSLAHYWGSQNYSQEHSAVDNYMISLLTYGEGYHNYHHTFSQDYRNGIRWFHFDPTKWLIWTLWKLGLASHLKQVKNDRIAKQLLIEHRNLILDKIKQSFVAQKEALSFKVMEISEHINQKLAQKQVLIEKYRTSKAKILRSELKALKKSLKEDWKEWKNTVNFVSQCSLSQEQPQK